MKKINAFLVSVLATAALNAAVIEQVIVRQQWPWSTDVKIEYKLSGVTVPVDLLVKAYNGDVELDQMKIESALSGDRYGIAESGVGTLVLDPVKAFGTEKVALANFKVKLTVKEDAEAGEVIYKIFDLTNGSVKNLTRADFYNGKVEGGYETDFGKIGEDFSTPLTDVLIWTGVTNDVAYKTTKLVMRKIPAKNVTTTLGRDSSAKDYKDRQAKRSVTFTNDYYMGVFEVTKAQWDTLRAACASNPFPNVKSAFKNPLYIEMRPISYLSAKEIRGSDIGITWPAGGHACDTYSFMHHLRTLTGEKGFDLPTEACWEYACRAGDVTDFNCGIDLPSNQNYTWAWLQSIARHARSEMTSNTYTPSAEAGGTDCDLEGGGPLLVGMLKPNAWGLYDMHGNMGEWCLDWYAADISDQTGDDPWGPSSGTRQVLRGGSYCTYPNDLHASAQANQAIAGRNDTGFRLCLTVYE